MYDIEDTREPYEEYEERSLEHERALDRIATAADWMVVVLEWMKRTKFIESMSDYEFGALEEVVFALNVNHKL